MAELPLDGWDIVFDADNIPWVKGVMCHPYEPYIIDKDWLLMHTKEENNLDTWYDTVIIVDKIIDNMVAGGD